MTQTDWRHQAACREEDPALFFPDGSTGPWLLVIEEAKAVCRHRCPVIDTCLQWALENRENGVWGGLSEDERQQLRRRAQRHQLTPEAIEGEARRARAPQEVRSLRTVWNERTARLPGGHLAWTGKLSVNVHGRSYTGNQLAFALDRGREPVGQVRRECDVDRCVLPQHVSDERERWERFEREKAAETAGAV